MWIVCITSVRHVLTVNGYGGRQTKENEKSQCFKGWETLVITVGALCSNGNISYFSQTGDKLDVVAPGVDVLSTLPNNETGLKDGTSMACPHVAGLAALILERNPRLTVTQVNDIIENNTKKVGPNKYNETRKNGTWNSYYGYGLINAEQALINTPR